jgi:hypothetical protein
MMRTLLVAVALTVAWALAAHGQQPRARDLRLPIGGTPGTVTGANDLRIYEMPVDRMLAAMKKYGRLP